MGAIIRNLQPQQDTAVFHDLLGMTTQPVDARAFQVLASHEQAQTMVDQDYLSGANDPEWTAFFVECMVEFLVWSHAPAGKLMASDIAWLEAQIERGISPSMSALLFALVRELNEVPERLTMLALKHSGNRRAALH